MKWIRWRGLIAFLVVVVLISGFWFLFLDGIVRHTIENVGTRLVGARVELRQAHVSLLPVGLTLSGLQVTDPDKPMTNAVEISRLTFHIEGAQLLRRKVIVDRMSAQGVRFGTPRQTSGALTRKRAPGKAALQPAPETAGFSLPSFQVPDVKTILAKEDLETLKLAAALKTDLQQTRQQWEQRLKSLPGKDTFAKYRSRIDQLQAASKGGPQGLLSGAAEVQNLRKEIEGDIAALKAAQGEFNGQMTSLRARLAQVRKAPREDVRRLQDKYGLSPRGLANLGSALLGRQIGGWTREAVAWYERLQPVLQRVGQSGGKKTGPEVVKPLRGSGVDVRFPEKEPLPNFLIRLADVSLRLRVGDLSGQIENITPDQDVLGKPLTFDFAGDKLQGVRSLSLSGTLDHIRPARPDDRAVLRAVGYRLQDVPLSRQSDWPVEVKNGLADIDVRAAVQGDSLVAGAKGNLASLQIAAGRPADTNPLTKALSSALSGVSRFTVTADVTGTLEHYNVALQTDLDRVLKQAGGKMVQDLSAEFTKDLAAGISEKVSGPLKEVQGGVGGLSGIGGELSSRLTAGNDVLGSLLKKGAAPKGLPGGLKLPF